MKRFWNAVLVGGVAVALGCGGQSTETIAKKPAKADSSVVKNDPKESSKEHDHSEWWCEEHGVPEADCSICQKEVFKKLKSDEICPNHPDRAKAQCFICNPSLREKFAAVYRAKNDKDPPEPKGNMPEKKKS